MYLINEGKYGWRMCFKHFSVELYLFKFQCCVDIRKKFFNLALPFMFSIYIYDTDEGSGNALSVSVFAHSIWWNLWTPSGSWSSQTPKWRNGCWHILDTLLGKQSYNRKVIEERTVLIPMPEGSYEATIKLCEDTWSRPRWFKQVIRRIDASMPKGIPHMGKGESEWDCGTDTTSGMCCPANSIFEGVGKIVADCLETRVRCGGWADYNWQRKDSK